MAKKRKKQAGGGLKGFILLAAIIIGALYLYQNDGKIFSSETIRTLTDKASVTENTNAKAPDGRYSLQLEIPKTIRQRDETIITHTGYTVSYNHHYKTPNWVAWELTRQETTGEEGRTNQFLPDPSLPEPRVETSDYTHSGYDRGHMAPAADMKWSKQAMKESFYMSNICPQNRPYTSPAVPSTTLLHPNESESTRWLYPTVSLKSCSSTTGKTPLPWASCSKTKHITRI